VNQTIKMLGSLVGAGVDVELLALRDELVGVLGESFASSDNAGQILLAVYAARLAKRVSRLSEATAQIGGRALALLVVHEWCGSTSDATQICPECAAPKRQRDQEGREREQPIHADGCEWGGLVGLYRRLKR
jgi:hypothetical protein